MAETQAATKISAVGRVMIPVTDQDRAIEFYRDNLGFEVIADIPFGDGNRWVEVALPGTTTALALVQPREQDPVGIDTHVALDTEDIDSDHAELHSRGVDVDDEIMRMGDAVPPMFWMRDQDGNTLLVVQPSR